VIVNEALPEREFATLYSPIEAWASIKSIKPCPPPQGGHGLTRTGAQIDFKLRNKAASDVRGGAKPSCRSFLI
jgi:hypothetical protein